MKYENYLSSDLNLYLFSEIEGFALLNTEIESGIRDAFVAKQLLAFGEIEGLRGDLLMSAFRSKADIKTRVYEGPLLAETVEKGFLGHRHARMIQE